MIAIEHGSRVCLLKSVDHTISTLVYAPDMHKVNSTNPRYYEEAYILASKTLMHIIKTCVYAYSTYIPV